MTNYGMLSHMRFAILYDSIIIIVVVVFKFSCLIEILVYCKRPKVVIVS